MMYSFASVDFSGVARNLTVSSSNGHIGGSGVGGSATISGGFASVEVRDIGGPTSPDNEPDEDVAGGGPSKQPEDEDLDSHE